MKELAIRAALVGASLVILGAGLEIGLRTLGPILPGYYRTGPLIAPDAVLGWAHIPSTVTWFKHPDFTSRVETNAEGRLGPPSTAGGDPRRRILLLGDSFVGATQLPYEESFAGRLAERLGPGVAVVNDGVSGYGTDQSVLLLEHRGLAERPDAIVLVVTVSNDIWNNDWALESQHPTHRKPYFRLDADGRLVLVPLEAQPASPLDVVRPVLARSALLTTLKTAIVDPLTTARRDAAHRLRLLEVLEPAEGEWLEAWRLTAALIARAAADAREARIPLVLVIAPDACQVHAELCAGRPDLSPSVVPQDALRAIAAESGVPVVDLLAPLRDRARAGVLTYFPRDLHWDRSGHEVAASEIASVVAPLLR